MCELDPASPASMCTVVPGGQVNAGYFVCDKLLVSLVVAAL